MADKDQPGGDIDFSDGELTEMGVELAGRDSAAPAPRRSRSMLRVPVDEVPRPQGSAEARTALSTEPSLPALPDLPANPADDVVEHAFRNGGIAEGVVPAELRLAATPAKDELDAFTAKLIADRDRVIEMEMEDAEDIQTDPNALAQLRDDPTPLRGASPQRVEDTPTREVTASPLPPPRAAASNPALAALARAVAVPKDSPSDWLKPSQATVASPGAATADAVWSSAPPPDLRAAPVAAVSSFAALDDQGDDAEMELDDGELEDVESVSPPARLERPRTLTPVVPPPTPEPTVNGGAPRPASANGHAAEADIAAVVAAAQAIPSTPPPATTPGSAAAPSSPTAHAPPPMPAPPPTPAGGASPPPAPAIAPLSPPAAAAPAAAVAPAADATLRPRRKRRTKQWFEEIFDDDYLRTLPFLTPRQTEREAQFVHESLQIPAGGALLDLACGYGRHAMEVAAKGYKVTGLDLSLPLLIRAADAARRVGVNVNFIHGDMREMTFENEFDGAYCMFTSFGYFDDDTNRKVAANLARAIKPGGKLLVEVVNRDYIVRDLPTRVWWQGDGCVVLEEVDFNYFSSRIQVQRSIIFEDGRQLEQEISIRAYSLHEIGKVLHHSGFRVTEVSGGLSLRGKFFGANSRQLIVVAEKKATP